MDKEHNISGALAAAITKSASKQTYYTIRFFVDRGRVDDAYRAYGYFRWVDDVLDAEAPFPSGDDAGMIQARGPKRSLSSIARSHYWKLAIAAKYRTT